MRMGGGGCKAGGPSGRSDTDAGRAAQQVSPIVGSG